MVKSNPGRRGSERLREDIEQFVVPLGSIAIWNLGQSCYVLKAALSEEWIIFDPYLTYAIETADPGTEFKREIAPPLDPEDLRAVQAVLISHHHDDHLDPVTLKRLAAVSRKQIYVTSPAHEGLLLECGIAQSQLRLPHPEETVTCGSFQITPISVPHATFEVDESGHPLYYGFLVTVGDHRIFYGGDLVPAATVMDAVKKFKPNLLFLPINGSDYFRTQRGIIGNMNAREACDFAAEVGAQMLIPMHFDMFSCNRDNPAHFVDYWFQNCRSLSYHMMVVGERFVYFTGLSEAR